MKPRKTTYLGITTAFMMLTTICGTMFAQESIEKREQSINPPPQTQEEKDAQKVAEGQKTKGEKAQPEIVAPPQKSESKESVPERSGVTPVMPEKKSPESGEDLQKRPIEESKNPGIKEGPPIRGGKNEGVAPKEEKPIEPKPEMKPPTVREPVTPLGKEGEKETPPKVVAPPAGGKEAQDIESKIKQKYQALKEPEISFEDFRKFEIEEAARLEDLRINPSKRYRLGPRLNAKALQTACGNGDFESGLNQSEWAGGYGSVIDQVGSPNTSNYIPPYIDFLNFTTGIQSGAITLGTSRQTLTNLGPDPYIPNLQMTGPAAPAYLPSVRSNHAVRIGNSVNGRGAELLSKTFTVSQNESILRFWYAVVMEDPDHTPLGQPNFEVRVLDSNNNPISGLVNLGNNSNKIVASNDAFLVQTTINGPNNAKLVYRDWDCAQIDLTQQVGKKVTIEFVTSDCAHSGHMGYAYIDNLCGKCGMQPPSGNVEFNAATSSKCGTGNICFNIALPTSGTATGSAVIDLNIYQNGVIVTTISSPPITSGTSYCFPINPATITGLNPALGGFDFTATGRFTLSTSTTVLTAGNPPTGQAVGNNNDYQISCGSTPTTTPIAGCCPGENLVPNGELDIKGQAPGSGYKPFDPDAGYGLFPGSYAFQDIEYINKFCPNWQLPAACKKTKDFTGGVMFINGMTNQPQGQQGVIYEQVIPLAKPPKGKEKSEYQICFHYLPLPACCFDIKPKLSVVIKVNQTPITLTNVSDVPMGCGNLFTANFAAPYGTATLQILLAEDGRGDGNDLLIDNISVTQLTGVPDAALAFTLMASPASGGGGYNITLTAPAALVNPPYNWVWEVWDETATPATLINTVSGNVPNTNFSGMLFTQSKQYLFKLKAWSPCEGLSGFRQRWSYIPGKSAAPQPSEPDPNPEPVKLMKASATRPESK